MVDLMIFKAENESLEYKNTLLSAGFNPVFLQVLEFQFENLGTLFSKISDPTQYDGLVFTSPRAVEATRRCFEINNVETSKRWGIVPIYAVGNKTYAAVQDVFGHDALGSDSGNADSLANFIIGKSARANNSFLFPCGSLRSETLPNRLEHAGFKVDSVTVYGTHKFHFLTDNLCNLISRHVIPNIFIFFSPSGVEYVLEGLKEIGYAYDDVKCVAIGPVTGEKLVKSGFQLSAVCPKPNPQSLKDTLIKVFK